MFPEEREYRVGPSGFVLTRPDGAATLFAPGALVWLQAVPQGADLQPTGERRRYETKVVRARESKQVRVSNKELKAIITAQDQAGAKIRALGDQIHALGGEIHAGKPYLVGETGPELFTSRVSGTITPHSSVESDGS